MEQGRQVVLCLFILLYLFYSFIHIFNSYQVVSCIKFCPFKRVKLIDCESVNRSDFKPGSGPG